MLKTAKYNAALFMIAAANRVEKGPIMSGSVTLEDKTKLPMSAFPKLSVAGDNYFSLSVGGQDAEHQYGALFPVKDKKSEISPDYTGSIDLVKGGDVRLRVAAWKRKAKDTGKTYISLAITPINPTGEYKDEPPADEPAAESTPAAATATA